ncbi:MAG: discoidin domain-containing protein [Actinomycetota bacterium]
MRKLGVVGLFIVVACFASPGEATNPSSPPVRPSETNTTNPVPLGAEHRIGVRIVEGSGELFDRFTGEKFVPRGANLIRLSAGAHSTLDPGRYDRQQIVETFARLAGGGYNVVRVFLNSRMLAGDESGLSGEYLDNAADLIHIAKAHQLQVLFTQDWLPEANSWGFPSDPLIDNVNSMYLARGGLDANRRFFLEWVRGLIARGAPLDALLAYELRNELYFTDLYPPFSLSSGTVTTANGRSYDLSSEEEKVRLLEDNLVSWIDEMGEAIRSVDPTALVTIGFFQPKGPNLSREGDDRLIETRRAILESTADFIDLHGYPGGELNLAQIVENFGLPTQTAKPVLLGEFGAEHVSYPSVDDAIRALVEWQIESCAYGFDGWLVWTWDSVEQPDFWNALDNDGAIGRALSPAVRPDPCAVGELNMTVELTRGATITASAATTDDPVNSAIDGLTETIWSAGDDAPQWVEIDLGAERPLRAIRLLVAQHPVGLTTHVVTVRGEKGPAREVANFTQTSADGDWLEISWDDPQTDARYVRVETLHSPSWVAWREISLLGHRR